MARHDFRCEPCGYTAELDIPTALGARHPFVGCPRCTHRMAWIPAVGRMDQGAVKGVGFRAFETFDAQNRPVRIESTHQLRRLERESEQAFRNGEGQPLVFRAWSQGQSNRDASALHASWDGGEHPTPDAKRRFGSATRSGQPDVDFGPGVDDTNCSALGDP